MDIDFVITWVDGSDPEWQAAYKKWLPANTEGLDVSEARYRDWGLLRYWFRGVEKFAPWVRKIHFVTNGQIPSWLNVNHPKLHLVNHKDIMPAEALPTFNSNAIEMNIGKIEGLSENFVYFNDDVFLVGDVTPEYFFTNGLPNDTAVTRYKNTQSDVMAGIVNKNVDIINRHFCKYKVMLRHVWKWFSLGYDIHHLRDNVLSLVNPRFASFYEPHSALPLQKHIIEEIWKACPQELSETTGHRFRSNQDTSPWLYRYWRLCKGLFNPTRRNFSDIYIFNIEKNIDSLSSYVHDKRFKLLLLNDSNVYQNYIVLSQKIADVFANIFQSRCSYEIA